MRTIIDLPEDQIEGLKRLGEKSRSSRAELIRQAVAEYLSHHQVNNLEEAFGIWENRQQDGLDYQNTLRREWEE